MGSALLPLLALLSAASARQIGGRFGVSPLTEQRSRGVVLVEPSVVDASHNVVGYEPECAVDGDEQTFWLVPGGQRMEMMS
eukprot:522688-Prymnesium_polylepis.1